MSGGKCRVSPLELRKRLLIAESELNRSRLHQEWRSLAAEVSGVADRASSWGAMASSIVTIVAGLAALTKGRPSPPSKSSWWQKIASGARLVGSLGSAFGRGLGPENGQS